MRLEHLIYLVAVVEQKSIHKAAEILYVSQPNISRMIKGLEDDLGVAVLKRSNHGVSLTKEGENVYYYARSIVKQLQALKRLKEDKEFIIHQSLNISVANLILEDTMMLKFYDHANSQYIDIDIKEVNTETLIQQIHNIESEIGISVVTSFQLDDFKKIVELKGLQMQLLDTKPLKFHVHKGHELAKRDSIKMHEVLSYPSIQLPHDYFSYLNFSQREDGVTFSDIDSTICMNNYHSIINMLKHTDAFLFGNVWHEEELNRCGIATKGFEGTDINMHLIWVKRKKEVLSQEAVWFIEMLKEVYLNK